MNDTYILLLSDLHLGLTDCRAKLLLRILKSWCFEWLIIVGDLHQEGNITDEQFEVIKFLRQIRRKVIYIDGNHDPAEDNVVGNIIGVREVVSKLEWTLGGKKFCATHGHKFDRWCFIFSEPLLDAAVLMAISFLKRMDITLQFTKWLDCIHRFFHALLIKKLKKYAIKNHLDAIICGHTHVPEYQAFFDKEGKKIECVNCGSWVTDQCSFVTVSKTGEVELHIVDANGQNC